MIDRYEFDCQGSYFAKDGDWVRYDEYKTEITELNKRIKELEAEPKVYCRYGGSSTHCCY